MTTVAIFGDVCVDAYWVGVPSGLSAEAAVPVLKQTRMVVLPGMAANVHKLLTDLGQVQVDLVYPVDGNRPVKNRLVTEGGEQLARWDLADWCTPLTLAHTTRASITSTPPEAVIVSDYGKGAMSPQAISYVRGMAERGIPLFVDTKGDPFTWLGLPQATLFPNEKEYRTWKAHYDWMPSVVHKQSSGGMSYLRYGKELFHEPSHAQVVRNVCGAGDAVLAAWVWATLQGRSLDEVAKFAMEQAGWMVSQSFENRQLPVQVYDLRADA